MSLPAGARQRTLRGAASPAAPGPAAHRARSSWRRRLRRAWRHGARPTSGEEESTVRLYRASGRSARRVGGTRSELTPRVLLGRMAAAAPDVGIAAAFAWVAVSPALWDAPMGTALWRAALMEFWAIHAGGFLMVPWIVNDWNLPRRALYAAGLVAAYSVVLGIASLAIGAWWPIVT